MTISRLTPLATLAAALVSACNVSDHQSPIAPAGTGTVRVAQADPTAGSVDVYIDATKVLTNFAFDGDTNIAGIAGGAHTLNVFPTGTTGTPALSQGIVVSNAQSYDMVIAGGTAGGLSFLGGPNTTASVHIGSSAALRILNGVDSLDMTPTDSTWRTVDVTLTGAQTSNTYSFTGLPEFGTSPVAPAGNGTPSGYNAIVPDQYTIVVTSTLFPADTAAIISMSLGTGQARTLVISAKSGQPRKPPATILVLPDSG
jgi:hypothetical protein